MFREKVFNKRILPILLFLILLIQMAPIVIILINSLRTNDEVRYSLFGLPDMLHWENYLHVFIKGNYALSYSLNIIIGIGSVILIEILLLLAVYGLVKLKAFGQRFFTGYFVASLSIPTFGTLISLFTAFNKMGLNNTLTGLILIFTSMNMSFCFMLLRAFFIGIPKELEEAAKIDGANEMQTLVRIILPMATPIISTIAIIVFSATWNNFMIPIIFYSLPSQRVVSLNFYLFMGRTSTDLAYVFVAAVLTMLPILVVFLLLQRKFIEGMAAGSVKG